MIYSVLLLLFIGIPILELAILLQVGEAIGVLGTVALVVLTGVVGAMLARLEGLKLLFDIRNDMNMGRMPAPRLVDGLLILIAGLVLITPGLLTDIVGFLLLIPVCREYFKKAIGERMRKKINKESIEVDYTEW